MPNDQDPLPPSDVEDVKDGPAGGESEKDKKPAPPPEKKVEEDASEQPS